MKKNTKFIIFGAIAAVSGLVVGLCAKKLLKKATKVVEALDEDESNLCLSDCDECPMHDECDAEGNRCMSAEEFYMTFSVPELRDEARTLGIKNIWRMTKSELINAIVNHTVAVDESDIEE